MSSYLLEKTACPRCRAEGHDNKGDNLAIYSDGHKTCYRCGYYVPPETTIETVKDVLQSKEGNGNLSATCEHLPSDISPTLSVAARTWLAQYHLTPEEMRRFWWSEKEQQLIYPVFDEDGNLMMWQARNWNKEREKYYTSGDVKNILHIMGNSQTRAVVLVEDVVSAIKVGRYYRTMPLFGGYISKQNLIRLRDYVLDTHDELGIWLDPDKLTDAIDIRNRARQLGIIAFNITSREDPKCHYDSDIPTLVNHWRFNSGGHQ